MMLRRTLTALLVITASTATIAAQTPARPDAADLRAQVFAVERAFAKSMADRRLDVFTSLLAEETIFFPATGALRGKAAVVGQWKQFFDGPTAPFSWEPDQVEVLDSGTLALSTGLVRDPSGKPTGRFNSIWRREPDGSWRIVFDKGSPLPPTRAAQ